MRAMRCGCRARRESASSVAICVEGERGAFGVVKGFNKGPFDAGDIEGETMAAAGELGIGGEPVGEIGAEIAQREGAAGVRGEVGDGKGFKGARADDGAQRGKIFGEGAEDAEPVLAVVDFEAFEGVSGCWAQ